jgi:glutathione S-transferase
LLLCQANPRSTAILAVAKANNLEIEIVETNTEKPTDEYLKYNALSKVPTFVGADGYVLSECIAIAVYSMCPKRHIGLPLRCPAPRARRAPSLS